MSVQCNTYVMIGAVLPYNGDSYDTLEPYMDSAFEGIKHEDGICVIFDGMNGKYIAIGEVLAKAADWQGFPGFCKPKLTASKKKKIAEKIKTLTGVDNPTVETLVFSHYR